MSGPYAPPGSDPNQPHYPYGDPQQQYPGAPPNQGPYGPPSGADYGPYGNGGGYPPQAGQYQGGMPQDPAMQGLAGQIGQMGIADPSAGGPPPLGAGAVHSGHRTARKKQRAYHALDQAPEPPASGMPSAYQQPGQPLSPMQPMNPMNAMQPMTPMTATHPPYGAQFGAPTNTSPSQYGASQFPVPANPPFQPTNPPSSMAEYNANMRGGPGGSGRVNPEEIPSIPAARKAATLHYKTNVYPTIEMHNPPPAAIDFSAVDQGNSSPKYCRLTLNTIPSSSDLLASTSLPLALILQPLAKQKPNELPVPVLNFGDEGPPRCRRCRTYINPFMSFRQNGAKFVCNMCSFPNDTPPNYYSPLDMTGKRIDREQRPELCMGTVEFNVPKEYWAKQPTPIRWLFILDVSMEAVNKGLIASAVKAIRKTVYGDESEVVEGEEAPPRKLPQGSKIAIMTYDKEVHFYNLSPALDQAQMLVMTDLEDPFVPLSEGLFVDPYESRSVIDSLLNSLPNLFSEIKNPEPALLPTLTAALTAIESTGGKIICTLSALPTWGPGRLHFREDSKTFGTEKERLLFSTEHQAWRKIATKMSEAGVGIDFFVTPSAYIDIAAVGHVSAVTGGEVFFYPNFVAQRDSGKLEEEIIHSVQRETGFQGLMKVRCSTGLQVQSYSGNFLQKTPGGDIELGVIDEDKAFMVSFSYDGKLDPKLDAHFQSALLYTTASGERRVRCHNVVAAVSEVAKEALRFVDQDAVVTAMAKEAATLMTEKPLSYVRGHLSDKCVDILAAYRKNFSTGSPPGQLVLPEALKEFGLYILCLLKTRAFRGGNVASDMRVHAMRLIKSMSATELSLFLYPRIIALHNLQDSDCFPDETGYLQIPDSLRASFSRTEEGGAYLVDNGQICLLWLHANVAPAFIADLFGPEHDSLQSLDPYLSELPVLDTLLNAQVRNLIQYLKEMRGSKALRIQLARQGLDGAEYEFAALLVEDRNNDAQSYVDWLVHVHKLIQMEITGQKVKSSSDEGGIGAPALSGLRPPYW